MDTNGFGVAMLAAGLMFGGLAVERAMLVRLWGPYYALGFPLGRLLLPIPMAPQGSGSTAMVRWEVREEGVLFWADPGSRSAPMGLHGLIRLRRRGGSVVLEVFWAPPWALIFAAIWLICLGLLRGEGWLTVPVGSSMVLGIAVLYWRSALTAARELRWAFVKGED